MTSSLPPEEDILARFTREYRETITEKEQVIAQLIDNLRTHIDLENLKALRMQIHKIAGSAGTYGFKSVSVVCRQFERTLLEKMDHFSEGEGDASWIQEFESYFAQIKEAFKEGSKD